MYSRGPLDVSCSYMPSFLQAAQEWADVSLEREILVLPVLWDPPWEPEAGTGCKTVAELDATVQCSS